MRRRAQANDLRAKLDRPVIRVPGNVVQGGDDRQGVLLYRAEGRVALSPNEALCAAARLGEVLNTMWRHFEQPPFRRLRSLQARSEGALRNLQEVRMIMVGAVRHLELGGAGRVGNLRRLGIGRFQRDAGR